MSRQRWRRPHLPTSLLTSPPPCRRQVDYSTKSASLAGQTLREGDWLSLNGSSGEVLIGQQPVKPPEMSGALRRRLWAS